jgi:cytochrome c biogenesis protein CcmG/thiol:disulfide interchange protein DsbE
MKINILITLFLGFLALIYTYAADHGWWQAKNIHVASAKPEPGKTVPDFTFTTIGGKTGALSDFKGRKVLLHFWASWCAPCLKEFPDLLAYAKKEKVAVIALSHDTTDGAIERFIDKIKTPLPQDFFIARDVEKKIAEDMYGTFKLPETYMIAPDGTLIEKISGAQTW